MRYPKLLKKGDSIGVCAPSAGTGTEQLNARLDKAHENVRALGYKTIETASVRSQAKCVSASADIRASEFMSLYENPDIAAIIPPWGGEFLMDILPLLDFARIRELPPKWVCGYSDTTSLMFPLTLLCDMATIHGSNYMNMGFVDIDRYDLAAFTAMSAQELTQRSSEYYGAFSSFSDITKPTYTLDKKTEWKSLDGADAHTFEGRLIGGCLDVMRVLIGTRFAPVAEFIDRYKGGGIIWTLESAEMSAANIYRTLWQMYECGWFKHSTGIIIGRADGYSDTQDFKLEDALRGGLGTLGIPVIYGADIGHIPPQIQIVNGAMGRVEYKNGCAVVNTRLL